MSRIGNVATVFAVALALASSAGCAKEKPAAEEQPATMSAAPDSLAGTTNGATATLADAPIVRAGGKIPLIIQHGQS